MEKLIAYVQHIYITDILHVSEVIRPQGGSCSSLDVPFTEDFYCQSEQSHQLPLGSNIV